MRELQANLVPETAIFDPVRHRPNAGWDPTTNIYETELRRQADIYVFAVLGEPSTANVDPLDLSHWRFWVLPTAALDDRCLTVKRIGLKALLAMEPKPARFGEIKEAIDWFFLRNVDAIDI